MTIEDGSKNLSLDLSSVTKLTTLTLPALLTSFNPQGLPSSLKSLDLSNTQISEFTYDLTNTQVDTLKLPFSITTLTLTLRTSISNFNLYLNNDGQDYSKLASVSIPQCNTCTVYLSSLVAASVRLAFIENSWNIQ